MIGILVSWIEFTLRGSVERKKQHVVWWRVEIYRLWSHFVWPIGHPSWWTSNPHSCLEAGSYERGSASLNMIYRFVPKGSKQWAIPLYHLESVKVLFHSIRTSGPPQTGRLRWTPYPQKWSEKASSGPPRMSVHLSPRDKMSTKTDSSTNQMVFHGVPSNVHSFPVSY